MNPSDPPVGTVPAAHAAVSAGSMDAAGAGVAVAVGEALDASGALAVGVGWAGVQPVRAATRATPPRAIKTVRQVFRVFPIDSVNRSPGPDNRLGHSRACCIEAGPARFRQI